MQTQLEMLDCNLRSNPPEVCWPEDYEPRNRGFTGWLFLPSDKLCLYRSREQIPGYRLKISDVIKAARRVSNKKPLTAYVADAMLEDHSRIPQSWGEVRRGEELSPYIVFAGTIFNSPTSPGSERVRVLTKSNALHDDWYTFDYHITEDCVGSNWYIAMIRT